MKPPITVRSLTFGYEPPRLRRTAEPFLKIDSLSFPEKKITAILGPNGSGKSTFLKLLSGICTPWSGEISLSGNNIRSLSRKEAARTVAFVSQAGGSPDILTKNLVLHGRFPHKAGFFSQSYSDADKALAAAAMEQMNIQQLAEQNVRTLSAGQRQRAFIALALAQDTPVLVLDEPFSFLDIREQLELSQKLSAMNKTIIIVMHDIPLALDLADNIAVFERGRLKGTGTPKDIRSSRVIEEVFRVRTERKETISFSL